MMRKLVVRWSITCVIALFPWIGYSSVIPTSNSVWGGGPLRGYPDLIVTLSGNGTIGSTRMDFYIDSLCSGPAVAKRVTGVKSFSYITGNAYKANLTLFWPTAFTTLGTSAGFTVMTLIDASFTKEGISACLSVQCTTSSSCIIGPPNTASIRLA